MDAPWKKAVSRLNSDALVTQLPSNSRRSDSLSVPIIATTACVTEDAKKESESAGFTAFMTKPLDMSKLLQTIQQLLRHDWERRTVRVYVSAVLFLFSGVKTVMFLMTSKIGFTIISIRKVIQTDEGKLAIITGVQMPQHWWNLVIRDFSREILQMLNKCHILLLSDLLYVMFLHAPIGFGACRKILWKLQENGRKKWEYF